MDIKGKVHEVSEIINVTETFKKRELIVEYAENPQYPEFIKFEAMQDKVNLFDNLKKGDDVEVVFNLRGRPWTDRNGKTAYFNSLIAWRVNVLTNMANAYAAPAPTAPPADFSNGNDSDDLPF